MKTIKAISIVEKDKIDRLIGEHFAKHFAKHFCDSNRQIPVSKAQIL
jgi:hypothetical protein